VPDDEARAPKQTLKGFIDENHRLISVLGVFAALILFALQLKLGPFTGLMIAGLFTCAMLLWVELLLQFPKDASGRLGLFEAGIQATMLVIVLWWLLVMEKLLGVALVFCAAWVGLMYLTGAAAEKVLVLKRFRATRFGKGRLGALVFGLVMVLACAAIAARLSTWAYPAVHEAMTSLGSGLRTVGVDSTRAGR